MADPYNDHPREAPHTTDSVVWGSIAGSMPMWVPAAGGASGNSLSSIGSNPITLTPGTSGSVIVRAPDETSTMLQFEDIAATSGEYAGVVVFSGSNGDGPNGRAWGIGIDVAANTPYRDMVIGFRMNADGSASDADGLYGSYNGGASATPASWAFGYAQPPDTYRLRVLSGSGDLTQGGLAVHTWPSQQGRPLVVFGNGAGETSPQVSVDNDFGLMVRANPINRTVADAVTNGTTTITSATAAFTPFDRGRMVVGTNIPTGAYIMSVTNATTVVINAAASGSGSGGSLTIYAPYLAANANSMQPFFAVTPGSGAGAVVSQASVSGFGPGTGALPTATLDVSSAGTNNATFKVRTPSNGSFQITATGASAAVTLGTSNASTLTIQTNGTQAIKITTTQSVLVGSAAIATNSTNGFPYLPAAAGSPSGTPTSQAGFVPIFYDTTNHKLWIYDGGWKGVVVS